MTRTPTPTDLAAADLLDRAADRLGPNGELWTRGAYRDDGAADNDHCRVCAVGALRWADSGDPCLAWRFPDAYATARFALQHQVGTPGVAEWNDRRRSARVVQRAMRDAARRLRDGKS